MRRAAAHTRTAWQGTSWRRLALLGFVFALALVQLGGTRAAVTNATVGQWSAPVAWPLVAVHMSLLPTGKVLAFDAWEDAPNSERIWDPGTGAFVPVPYGRNLFCAGHVQLADGRTLIVGGNVSADVGLADTTIFNPTNNTYFRGQDMSVTRWYPTATQLPDGRVLTFAGDNIIIDRPGQLPPFADASVDSLPSIYNPTTNQWTDLTNAKLTSPLYPFLFVLSDGRIFNAGPDKTTRILDVGSATWSTVGTSPIDAMSAVMYRPNKIMKAGRWADPDFVGPNVYNSDGGTAVIDMSAPTPTWRSTAPMAHARSYQNMTLLPDGTVLASGGMTTSDGTDLSKAVLPAEIWNPDTETWTEVAALQNGREYHSTALLLPDGRVLMAGGGRLGGRAENQLNAEIYSPPYLFKGARPTITTLPAGAGYGTSFDVTTPDAASITKVSLIRSPSVTHAFDQNQRFQFLNFTAGAGKVTVQAPASANLAPPGDYLLYLLDGNGVPSVGKFIRVSSSGDTTPPTAPSGLTATVTPGQVALSWTAATDASGIAGYDVHRSTTAGFTPGTANRIAQPVGTSYTDNPSAGTYYYKVVARDTVGNIGPPSNEVTAVVATGPPPGLVGSWGFDEGAGTTTADRSGNTNNGTLSGATWTTLGKYGSALNFNGTNNFVSVPDSNSLDVTTGITMEGWVKPGVSGGWRTLLAKETGGNIVWGFYANTDRNAPESQVTANSTQSLNGTVALPAGVWSHVAGTYDGTTHRMYVNGTQVVQQALAGGIATSAGALKIGGNSIWSEWFSGQIDEVRVYNRALSASEIQTDMNTPITAPDAVPPGAPGTLTTTPATGQIGLSWGAATDNIGVARYNVYRSTTAGFTPSTANRIAQPTGTTYTDSAVANGTTYYYRVTAEDAVGNVGPASNEASGSPLADATPPTVPAGLTATATSTQVALSWSASSDAGGVVRYNVHRSTTAGFTPAAANRIAQPTGTSYSDGAVSTGTTYYYRVTAEDGAGNISGSSSEASATVPTGPPPGLVAAYGFDAGSGTAVVDQSGNGNNGTLTNATWAGAGAGRFGNALTFNGTNASVSVPDSNSLDATSAITMEGWVKPAVAGGWRTLLAKETGGNIVWGFYANTDHNAPESQVTASSTQSLNGTAALSVGTWTHVAGTYDGTTHRLYVNGTQVAQLALSGGIATSTGALKIGGNAIWSEWFNGQIDEVRIYNRALSAAEIQADMNSSISSPDATAPTAPGTLTATGTLTTAQLSWGAATDNVGVARYNVYRSTTPGFTPSVANRIGQPGGTTYTDTVAAGTYYYKVTAEDAAANVGPASNEASATVGDTVAPSAPGTLTATGGIGRATLAWGAATDNVGVARYNVYRSTTAGFVPGPTNRIAQPTGTSYIDNTAPGVYFYKVTAEDAAGNAGPATNEATATVTTDTTAPTTPTGLTGPVSGTTVNLSWTASTDNVGVTRYNVHRGTTSGFTPSASNRIAQPTGTTYSDTGLATGTYFYVVTAEDAAGNISAPTSELTASIADAGAPTAPGSLAASVAGANVSLSWTAATDNIGVVRYNVHRGTTSGFTPSAANRIGQPTGLTFADNGLASGTYFYKVTAEDAAGNVGPVSNTATATVADTTAPTAPASLTATGGAGQAALSWSASTDNVGVVRYSVHRSTVAGYVPGPTNRIAQPTGTTYTDTVAAGTYFYKVVSEDAAGNLSAPSPEAVANVGAAPPTGLVAAYGFDAGSGTTAVDQSGNGNNGTIANATWAGAGAGKFGNALSFNGTNAMVTVADANSLDLTSGMTVEAWVRPTVVSGFRTVLVKEQPGDLVFGLYGSSDSGRPQSQVTVGSVRLLDAPSAIPAATWTHLAVTFDGTTQRLFVDGTQVASLASAGNILVSNNPVRIGGNSIWSEWFNGLIDEVRIYNRAQTAAQIQADMNNSISAPDATPPSAPGALTANGGLGQASLSWGAATDNVGVVRYGVHRSTTPGFTASAANRVAQPTGTSYTDSGLAAGTYYYKVTAEDAAGNVGPPGNEASAAVTADTTPPTVPANLVATPSPGQVALSWSASTDAGGIARYEVHRSTTSGFTPSAATRVAQPTTTSYVDSGLSAGTYYYKVTAVDNAGNTSAPSTQATALVPAGAPAGLVAAYGFDAGTGTTAADQSGTGNTGTLSNATWSATGKFGGALSFNGTNASVSIPDSSSLDLTTGMTVEGWVRPSAAGGFRTLLVKERPGDLVYGVYSNVDSNRPESQVTVNNSARWVDGTSALPTNVWSHVAGTYDGSVQRLYVNGTQVAQLTLAGTITTSNNPVKIGGNAIWGEWFAGLIDEVRVYNRALTAAQIQTDMNVSITPDNTPPTVTSRSPAPNATGINVGTSVTARFNELMDAGSLTSSTFEVSGPGGSIVPATVTYDALSSTATLTLQSALQYGVTYTATVRGGASGVKDYSGNALAADSSWSFSTEASPPSILVVASTTNKFGMYVAEILRNEGLQAFTTLDVSLLSPAVLSGFDVVILGETALSPAQVTAVTSWVNAGGNLIAMRPDKQLAGLLGLNDASSTLANAYLRIDNTSGPGAGIVGSTIQFHSTADRYTLNGATAVATLFSDRTTATANPAVTLRNVGSSGGQAAAFTFDLARSVVYTRQGNPAWASQERDGVLGTRPDDMFYGAKAGDVQPDWLDTTRIAIPQADEQQRLLVNLITQMERDKMPLPHFWYLPRGKKAVVVLSGDDHAPVSTTGFTASNFNWFKSVSPAGCNVAAWECVRATSYIYPESNLTAAQVNQYVSEGFEISLHTNFGSQCPAFFTGDDLAPVLDSELAGLAQRYPANPAPQTMRTHCVGWPDWASEPKLELARGIRLDANYYHYPGSWIANAPGFMTGGGFPMRFADLDGTTIDVYQQNTNMNDEASQVYPATVDALLDNAVGPNGYYGAFGTNIHHDFAAPRQQNVAIVQSAQSRGIPLISYKQLLTWVDGRNSSTIRGLSWNAGTFTFTTTIGTGASGLQTMLPTQGPSGTLSALTCGGSPRAYTLQTIKGIQYAMFDTFAGACVATYS